MPLTLYWYILKDLLKLLAMATGALVLVMSMGFMIKPLSEGSLDAPALLKLLFYVMPGMLTYALPVGAAFAATLVFFRLSADNEITACAMSGISYRSLLMPTIGLGLVLTVSMFFLANYVIPSFWQRVAQVAQQDIARWFVKQIEDRHVVNFGSEFIIYADRAWVEDLPPAPDDGQNWPYQRVALQHAAVAKINHDTGGLDADFTGELAVADLYRVDNRTFVTVKLTNAALKHPQTGTLVVVDEHAFPARQIPSLVDLSPKMLSLQAMKRMSEQPDLNPEVEQAADELRQLLAQQTALGLMESALAGQGATLDLAGPRGDEYTVSAPRVVRDGDALSLSATEDRPVIVRVGRGAVMRQRLEARSGRIDVVAGGEQPRIAIRLSTVTVIDPRLPADLPEPTQVKTVYLTLLRMNQSVDLSMADHTSFDLLDRAAARDEPEVAAQAGRVVALINKIRERIATAVHERAAMSVCTLLVMLMGGAMAMLLRQQVPLVIFFWCFLPAIVAIFMVNSGKNLIKADSVGLGDWFGAAMIWSGNVFLLLIIAAIYRRLCRH